MNYFARHRPDRCCSSIFLEIRTRRIQLRMAARRQSRIDHAVLHGVFYMHISLPIPLAGSRSRVKLRRSRRPDHSSSKSSHALLGTSDPGQYPFFIPRSSAIRGRLISPVTSAAAKPTPITSGIQESHLVLVRPGN